MTFKNQKNAYWCESCGGYIVTIDVDDGVTPMFLSCRVMGDIGPENTCHGKMRSMMYPDEPWPVEDPAGIPIPTIPTWEWYMPDPKEVKRLKRKNRELYEHIHKGGLVLRKISDGSGPADA